MRLLYPQRLFWWLASLLLARPAAAQLNFSWATSARSPSILSQQHETMDGNGNTYIAGAYLGSITFGQVSKIGDGSYVTKYDASGNVLWSRRIASDGIWSIKADAAGMVWVAGHYRQEGVQPEGSPVALGANPDYRPKVYLVKYSPQGDLLSTSLFLPSTSTGAAYAPYIALDGQGGVFICYTDTRFSIAGINPPPPFCQLTLARVNAAGTVVQTRNDFFLALPSNVGYYGILTYGLCFDAIRGHLSVTGYTRGSLQAAGVYLTTQNEGDMFVASYTANLDDRWSKLIYSTPPVGTRAGTVTSIPYGLAVDGAGNLALAISYTGTIQVPGGPQFALPGLVHNTLLVQFSNAGTYQWFYELPCTIGGTTSSLAAAANGTLYLAVNARGGFPFGNYQLLANPLPHPWYSNPIDPWYGNFGLVAAFSPTGQPLWARQDTGQPAPGSACFTGVACNPQGTVVTVSGISYGATGFGGIVLPTSIDGNPNNNITYNTQLFVAQLDTASAPLTFLPRAGAAGQRVALSGRQFQGVTAVSFNGVPASSFQVNASGDQLVAVVPAGATTGPIAYAAPGGPAATTQAFQVNAALTTQAALTGQVSVYPNPAPGHQVRIQASAGLTPAQVAVRDVLGQLVPVGSKAVSANEVELTGLASGLYVVQLQTPGGPVTRRVVVE